MLSRWLVSCLVALFAFWAVALPVHAQTDSDARVDKTRRYLTRMGTGKQVDVTVDNGRRFKGNVLGMTHDSFDIRTDDRGQSTTILFRDVKDIKRPGLSRAAKIGIVVASVAVVLIVIARSTPIGPTFR